MIISKEKALKNIEEWFEKLKLIKSNYSFKEISKKSEDNYKFLIFTNFIKNSWDLNNWRDINIFLDFYWLERK